MSLRVVVYAEGSGEGTQGLPPPPGECLAEETLGPARVLVRRCLVADCRVREAAVRFDAPLRTRGRMPRGSDLLDRETLTQLLTWPRPDKRPGLAVVLVDADGRPERKSQLDGYVASAGLHVATVVAVAVQEFEAWLVADEKAAARALARRLATTAAPEGMKRREAKELLARWMEEEDRARHWRLRRTIADLCDLGQVGARCPAFVRFREDLLVGVRPAEIR